MSVSKKINQATLRLERGDITDFEVEAIVFYAREDLKLGAGFGNAIAVRGGPSIQKELEQFGTAKVTDVFLTGAGNMKTKYIIHAVGPKFQEEFLEKKLAETVANALRTAEAKGIQQIAFPPMGAGFYGVPLAVSAKIMLETIQLHLQNRAGIQEIIIKALDAREYESFFKQIEMMS